MQSTRPLSLSQSTQRASAYAAGALLLACSVGWSQAEATENTLSAQALKAAISGKSFSHVGMVREGPIASSFAQGYITAIAERASEDAVWCGAGKVLPHEMISRVFDHLTKLEDLSGPARSETIAALSKLNPCD